MVYTSIPTTTVRGFVVNTYTALNLDIDIMFASKDIAANYKSTASKNYYYEDQNGDTYKSKAYRCRLRGLSLIPGKKVPSRKVLDKIQKKLNEQRDWVLLKISDIDSYNRILVDIIDPISKVSLNDYIISNFPEIYQKYTHHQPYYQRKNTFKCDFGWKKRSSPSIPYYWNPL